MHLTRTRVMKLFLYCVLLSIFTFVGFWLGMTYERTQLSSVNYEYPITQTADSEYPNGTSLYQNKTYGFSLEYPQTYSYQEDNGIHNDSSYQLIFTSSAGQDDHMTITIESEADVEYWAEVLKSELIGHIEITQYEETPIVLKGSPGIRITYTTSPRSEPQEFVAIVVAHNSYTYTISGPENIVESILPTFTFLP